MRGQIHDLELVYPPISNQEAEWIKDDPAVQAQLDHSNLYFIGQKPETFYTFPKNVLKQIEKKKTIPFTYVTGERMDTGSIDLVELLKVRKLQLTTTLDIEMGEKMIRISQVRKGKESRVLDWQTTEKILFDRSRQKLHIKGLNNYRDFSTYYLHYVGISKKENSLQRLVVKPHDKRLRILSNEHPFNSGSRLTDEIILFFFRINSLEIKQYLCPEDFDEFGTNELGDYSKIVADCEKAFVKIMDTQYNEVKFRDYPFSTDGLFDTRVNKHTYSINEDLIFLTNTAEIAGGRKQPRNMEGGDFIAVDKEKVELIKIDSLKLVK